MTKVMFRKFWNGDVIALFPQVPATRNDWECMSYMHGGQHGSAYPSIVNDTKPATSYEYADLYNELKSIGYDSLKLCYKFTNKDYQIRKRRNYERSMV